MESQWREKTVSSRQERTRGRGFFDNLIAFCNGEHWIESKYKKEKHGRINGVKGLIFLQSYMVREIQR